MEIELKLFTRDALKVLLDGKEKKWDYKDVDLSFLTKKFVEEFTEVMVELKNIERHGYSHDVVARLNTELIDISNMAFLIWCKVGLKKS